MSQTIKAKTGDMTEGSISKKLLAFVIPVFIMQIIQNLYNITDMVIVGHYVGSAGMSAANLGGLTISVALSIITGLSNGGNIYIGQLIGAKRTEQIPRVIGSIVVGAGILALVITGVLLICARPILTALGTPAEALEYAVTYLCICAAGTLFVYVYNAMAAVYRAHGKSVPIMLFVIISVSLNILLDWLFVGPLHFGIAGAAAATIISQFVCMLVCLLHAKKTQLFDFKKTSLRIDGEHLKVVVKLGLPQAFQFGITSVCFLLINGFVNQYGVYASALAGAVNKITMFAIAGSQAFQAGMVTFTAQNIAQKKTRRIMHGMLFSMAFSLCIAGLFWAAGFLFPKEILSIFTTDANVLNYYPSFLHVMLIASMIESLMFNLYGVIAGSGHTLYVFFCAIISAIVVRYTLVWVFDSFTTLGFIGIAWAYVCAPAASGLAALIYILSGKWKKTKVLK